MAGEWTAGAQAPTVHAARYVRQLARHWAHKFKVEERVGGATIEMSSGAVVELVASPDRIALEIEAPDEETLTVSFDVVVVHLDRFAFREAPLAFERTTP